MYTVEASINDDIKRIRFATYMGIVTCIVQVGWVLLQHMRHLLKTFAVLGLLSQKSSKEIRSVDDKQPFGRRRVGEDVRDAVKRST